MNLSYQHGASSEPLLGCTIDQQLATTAARLPDLPALIVRHQNVRWTWGELGRRVDASPPACWRSGSSAATASASGRPTAAEWTV